ncbi:DUF4411 family protein [Aerococcus sp. UMB8608]|uniref:DUF4411 family protein n=1 Tax=Aerococcus sanguinicola TaxID=119206 RepID=A0A5N1GP71_9LACT|nr:MULTISPECIES: DUF4411 family protein [Aerococcus]KAA9302204.1 DUF4411 family protein [Aerococcus sanguinicola]MDK6368367.1 DUF4411 family protein [Aerococcus sp. UMB9870]MDK6679449.1 DUF4411 family protein [Aerococcus sp. UMB8608]MDK6687215.1 DUF4411 family protein [Aerococcus sp. UMB8623]MDK6941087.1 DUF4411 family protein [Aerococcus sp. UMB8487]
MYLIDANILIDAGKKIYPQDVFPSYWTELPLKAKFAQSFMLTRVFNELQQGDDDTFSWVDEHFHDFLIKEDEDYEIIKKWAEVIHL